jgi:hypothetical protein
LAFSYWIDNLGFETEGKLAAVLIKPSLGVSNWPVIYIINFTPTVLWHQSTLRHDLPPAPPPHRKYWRCTASFTKFCPPEDGSRGSISLVRLWKVRQRVYAVVNFLGPSGWGKPVTATEIELLHDITILMETMLPPIHGKVFVVTIHRCLLGLDLATARLFILEFPDGVERNYMLSRAEDSGLYLVNADGF